jgi:hypothetical protein
MKQAVRKPRFCKDIIYVPLTCDRLLYQIFIEDKLFKIDVSQTRTQEKVKSEQNFLIKI